MVRLCVVCLVIIQGVYVLCLSDTQESVSEGGNEYMLKVKAENDAHVHQKRSAITKHRYVGVGGQIYRYHAANTINIDGTSSVSDYIMDKVADCVSKMVKHIPASVIHGISRNSHGLGIFTTAEKVTVFPENAGLAAPPQCTSSCSGSCSKYCSSDGRHFQDMGGLTNSRSSIRTDRFLCSSHVNDNIIVHELAHLVYNYMPAADRQRVDYVYNYAKQHGVWANSYEMTSATEYWAEATSCFFLTNTTPGVYPTGGMNKCSGRVCASEANARYMLQHHDPWLFNVLSKIYTNNQPNTPSGLTPCI